MTTLKMTQYQWYEQARKEVVLIDLMSAPYHLLNFTGRSPDIRTEEMASVLEDGEMLVFARYNNVEDVASVLVSAPSQEGLSSALAGLEQAITEVKMGVASRVDRMFLVQQPEGSATPYRSRMYKVWMTASDQRGQEWRNKLLLENVAGLAYTVMDIHIERDPWWEGPLTELPLTNGNGSKVVGGISIWNHYDKDTGHQSYVNIDKADILGGIPAPVKITILNDQNDATPMRNFWVGLDTYRTSDQFYPTVFEWQAELATLETGLSEVLNASYSGGKAIQCDKSATTLAKLMTLPLASVTLSLFYGRWIRFLGRLTAGSSNARIQARVTYLGTTTLMVGDEIAVTAAGIYDLGVFRLPPSDAWGVDPRDLRLEIWGYRATGGNLQFTWDDLFVTPAEEPGGYCVFEPQGTSMVPYTYALVIDSIEKTLYVYYATTTSGVGTYIGSGSDFFVWPGRAATFLFLFDNSTPASPIDWKAKIKIEYRPRRIRL